MCLVYILFDRWLLVINNFIFLANYSNNINIYRGKDLLCSKLYTIQNKTSYLMCVIKPVKKFIQKTMWNTLN